MSDSVLLTSPKGLLHRGPLRRKSRHSFKAGAARHLTSSVLATGPGVEAWGESLSLQGRWALEEPSGIPLTILIPV